MIQKLLGKMFPKAHPSTPPKPSPLPQGTLYGRSAGRLEGDRDPHFRQDHDYEAEDNRVPTAPPKREDPKAQDVETLRLPPGMFYGSQEGRKDKKS